MRESRSSGCGHSDYWLWLLRITNRKSNLMINRIYVRSYQLTSLLCAIAIVVLSACSANNSFSDDSPPSAKHIPAYPNAVSIKEEAVGNVHRTVFTTADGGTNVLDYYKSILVPEGWAMYPIPSQSTPTVSN